jgi:peptide/nickel transport system substrate-binding protein
VNPEVRVGHRRRQAQWTSGTRRAVSLVCACTLALAACSGSGKTGSATTTALGATSTSTNAQPKTGGTITFATYAETNGLDPTISFSTGVIGGHELAALYDVLMRYDPATGKYSPGTAQSLEPNSDSSVWTLKLRPNIKFTDGTDYDADAVKFNIERHTAPGSKSNFISQVSNVKSMDVIDPLTLRFNLTSPLASFPYVLSVGPGMIGSPTAIKRLGAGFNTNPVGAGPFMLDSYAPKEALILKRNPNYWNGAPYLDSIKFVNFVGAAATYEELKGGGVDVAFLREPQVNEMAKAEQKPNFIENQLSAPLVLAINNGVRVTCSGGQPAALCAGKPDGTKVPTDTPGKDIRVRQAVAAAIDPKVINDRAYGGKAIVSTDLFAPGFKWNPKVPGPAYDPARAKSLIAEAKAAGWNGKIRLSLPQAQQSFGLAIQAMLQAAGIDVTADLSLDTTTATLRITVQHDYDLGNAGYSFGSSDRAYFILARQFQSDSPGNTIGYASPDMDAALKEARVATTDAEKTAAYGKIATIYSRDVPSLVLDDYGEVIAWNKKVHGIVTTSDTVALFDKAWVG